MRAQVRAVGQDGPGWRALPKFPRNAGEPWAEVWQGPRHVIFGHHARRRLQVRWAQELLAMDFGWVSAPCHAWAQRMRGGSRRGFEVELDQCLGLPCAL